MVAAAPKTIVAVIKNRRIGVLLLSSRRLKPSERERRMNGIVRLCSGSAHQTKLLVR